MIKIPKRPILLLHGLFGFRNIGPLLYFQNIINPLKELGIQYVDSTWVHPTDSIENRALTLRKQVDQVIEITKSDKIHLIGHSMGGLDARYLISKLDDNRNIQSLTTLCTPHRGSYIADWAMLTLTQKLKIEFIFKMFDVPLQGLEQLSPMFMRERFNVEILNREDVTYNSYGAFKENVPVMSPLYYFHKLLTKRDGRNDGLVALTSSHWLNHSNGLHYDIDANKQFDTEFNNCINNLNVQKQQKQTSKERKESNIINNNEFKHIINPSRTIIKQGNSSFEIIQDCDHRDVINWNPFFNATPIYENIMTQLYDIEMSCTPPATSPSTLTSTSTSTSTAIPPLIIDPNPPSTSNPNYTVQTSSSSSSSL